jgi:hypothetical protein
MDSKNSNIMQYRNCIIRADVHIISKEKGEISYNGFTNPTIFQSTVTDLEGKAILCIDKTYSSGHILNRQSFLNQSGHFLKKTRIHQNVKIHPLTIIIDKNGNPTENQEIPDNILNQLAEFTEIQYESVSLFSQTLDTSTQTKDDIPDAKPTFTIKNNFHIVDIIELTTLLKEAEIIKYKKHEFTQVINQIAKIFGIQEISSSTTQRAQFKSRKNTFKLLDKLIDTAEKLKKDRLW